MNSFKIYNNSIKYLKDNNLSLSAKGILTLILTNTINLGKDIEIYCSDSIKDIKNTLLELQIAKYLRYNPKDDTLEAYPIPYDNMSKKENELNR